MPSGSVRDQAARRGHDLGQGFLTAEPTLQRPPLPRLGNDVFHHDPPLGSAPAAVIGLGVREQSSHVRSRRPARVVQLGQRQMRQLEARHDECHDYPVDARQIVVRGPVAGARTRSRGRRETRVRGHVARTPDNATPSVRSGVVAMTSDCPAGLIAEERQPSTTSPAWTARMARATVSWFSPTGAT